LTPQNCEMRSKIGRWNRSFIYCKKWCMCLLKSSKIDSISVHRIAGKFFLVWLVEEQNKVWFHWNKANNRQKVSYSIIIWIRERERENGKSMKEKISEIFLWVITIGLVLIVIFDRNITMVTMIAFLVIMCICCPGIHLIFYRKSKIKISSYKFLQYFLPLFSVIIAIYFTIFIIFRFKIEDLDVAKIVLKIFVFYLFFYNSFCIDRKQKKRIFYFWNTICHLCIIFIYTFKIWWKYCSSVKYGSCLSTNG